ncbi:PREDICTED: TBC1 domain family member 10A [Charadrius vociferus]|uniref:TBC1 domain family member 10A n=1 Tax=Charadrius vociferus TaxID=50402 RepID=UPI00052125DD|nr:PREDICTED: TBC1 domain family member 10A [Charadrius vociferus]
MGGSPAPLLSGWDVAWSGFPLRFARMRALLLEEVPLEVLRQRESKWLDMINIWDKWMAKKHKKIRLRCQKGIPPSLRGRAWQYLSGSKVKLEQNMGKFDELDLLPGDPKWLDVIERDLHRQQDLFRVLKAYTLYRPEEGYCQAQAPIAAVLLMHMPAEQAFWCLVQICEKYLPGYYSEKLEAIQLDGQILFSLLHKVSPVAYKHLSKQKIDPILYMTEWFMCAFSRTLPWSSVLRVWDMFFCEGVKIIFRVGLVLLKHTLGSSDKLKSCQGQYETMERLRALSPKIMQETFLVQEFDIYKEESGECVPVTCDEVSNGFLKPKQAASPTLHPVQSPQTRFCVLTVAPDTLPAIATMLIDVLFYSHSVTPVLSVADTCCPPTWRLSTLQTLRSHETLVTRAEVMKKLQPSHAVNAVTKGLFILWAVPGQGGRPLQPPTLQQIQALVRHMAEDAQELFNFYEENQGLAINSSCPADPPGPTAPTKVFRQKLEGCRILWSYARFMAKLNAQLEARSRRAHREKRRSHRGSRLPARS